MYSVGLLLTVVPARDGGRDLSSGRTVAVVARDVVDFAGTMVRSLREVRERDSLDERRRAVDVDEPLREREFERDEDACVLAVGAR